MNILSITTGDFAFIVDGQIEEFTDYNDVPEGYVYDHVLRFVPDQPPEPHTLNDHEAFVNWINLFNTLIANQRSSGKPACRGDLVDKDIVHCSVPLRQERSPNVFVNGIGWSRQGDNNHPHLLPGSPCPIHQAPIALGSPTVFVNGKGGGRIGDAVAGCTSVATGSENVFCGP